jgi:hypothetical protein
MPKKTLNRLPSDLAFLAPCIREMMKLRVGYKFPGNAKENPEDASDHEIERFLDRDMRIMGRWLRDQFPSKKSEDFYQCVSRLALSLNEWLQTVPYREEDKELRLLHCAVGLMMNPVPFFKRQSPKKRKRDA